MTDAAVADAQPRAVQVLGRVPLHPALAAIWPALALWAANVDEVLPAEVVPTVWQPLAAVGVLWAVVAALLRSVPRAALVATVAAVVVLNAGRLAGDAPGRWPAVIAGIAVLLALGVAWGVPRGAVRPITAIANVAAIVLVALSLPPILTTWLSDDTAGVAAAGAPGTSGVAGRDIFYIIPDRYPRADTLASVFDHDNSPFIGFLESRGFQVADRSLANYPKTAHSLAATWNLATLDELIPDPPADGGDWGPLYGLLRDHRLGHVLTDAGYRYDHLGSWWSPTASAVTADRVLRVDTATEFGTVWRSLTLLPSLTGGADEEDEGELSLRERNRRYSSYQLDELDRLARERSRQPRFVLAHVTVPHEPYVFDADGSFVTQDLARERGRETNFVNQVEYLNSRLTALVEELTSGPEETWPIIVIQSDEGPHPRARTGADYDWTVAPTDVLQEKLRTFSAVLLPGSDLVLPEDLTGVDTWRYVLDEAIGTDFGPHPDPPVEVFPGEDHLYDLVDVRDRVS